MATSVAAVASFKEPSDEQCYIWAMEVFYEDEKHRWYRVGGVQCSKRNPQPNWRGKHVRCEFVEGHRGPCDFE